MAVKSIPPRKNILTLALMTIDTSQASKTTMAIHLCLSSVEMGHETRQCWAYGVGTKDPRVRISNSRLDSAGSHILILFLVSLSFAHCNHRQCQDRVTDSSAVPGAFSVTVNDCASDL